MTVEIEHLGDVSVGDLAHGCARQTSRGERPPRDLDPCYELFRRACALQRDEDAWQAIVDQYHRLVRHWLAQYASDDTCQGVFLRFWKRRQSAGPDSLSGFPSTSAIIAFLQSCAVAERIESWRKEKRAEAGLGGLAREVQRGANSQPYDADVNELVLSKLNSDQERAVFELTYCYNLKPGEIQAEMPALFSDVRTVYRVKENMIKRLRRDAELEAWWEG